MTCLGFPELSGLKFVADTSVLINLEASGFASTIIQAAAGVLFATKNAFDELVEGERLGYSTANELRSLEKAGNLNVVELGQSAEALYRTLIEGPTAQTLGDGEAATLAYAVENDAIALIDERKATRICKERFNGTRIVSTVDLMLHGQVKDALGTHHSDAVFAALTNARMHVPHQKIEEVVKLLGSERAAVCPSLPICNNTQ